MRNLENVKLVCEGFEASAESKENILIVFKKLLDEVPYGAFIQVTLKKIATGFEGLISVNSIAGDFISTEIDMTPQDLVNKLFKDLHLQLGIWKSTRFQTSPNNEVTA